MPLTQILRRTTIKKITSMIEYDYIIIGSGFGGSVSALRLSEKGYSVLVIEKGKWYGQDDFPKSNWNLRKWLWLPSMHFYGIMKMTFYRHIGILSGTGVGGGSLVYANTLPKPKDSFYKSGSWAKLADWKKELKPHYQNAYKMLGATINPNLEEGDLILKDLAKKNQIQDKFNPTKVAVFFGEPEKEVEDPFFNGLGPKRSGCTFCGGCMTGCQFNAKNTLDKNYLHLAQQKDCKIIAEKEVYDVIPQGNKGQEGYIIKAKNSTKTIKHKYSYRAKNVIFAGGVLGTMNLLLKLKKISLPDLSNQLGKNILTNNEALIFSITPDKNYSLNKGIAIGSIVDVDDSTSLEVVRYNEDSGFWRIGMLPNVKAGNLMMRLMRMTGKLISHPIRYFKIATVKKFGKQSAVLLFMQQIDTKLTFKKGLFRLKSKIGEGEKPQAQIPLAYQLAEDYSEITGGTPMVFLSETLLNIPSTAHILGGATMGKNINEGVIDKNHKVFGYENMMICDGSTISSNPGVNPALTITAMTERAMEIIPKKK